MNNILSTFVFILFTRFINENNSVFIKKVKYYQNESVVTFCLINHQIDKKLLQEYYEKFLKTLDPVTIIPNKLITIEVNNSNRIITKYYPKNLLKVKPTSFFEKEKYLLLFLLFLFIILFHYLMKKRYLHLQKIIQTKSETNFCLKKNIKFKNVVKLKKKLKKSTKLEKSENALLKVSTFFLFLREVFL